MFIKVEKRVLVLMTGYDDFEWYPPEVYYFSSPFLCTLVQNASNREWKNLDNVTVAIQWNFNEIVTQDMIEKFDLIKYKPRETILTNPLVPLTLRKEFKFDETLHRCLSYYTINTKSDFKYKSIGNIFYNSRQWISNYCKNYQGNILKLSFRVNIELKR